MKAIRILTFSGAGITIASMMLFSESCRKDDELHCSSCEVVQLVPPGYYSCVPNAVDYKCPPEMVHATYNYYECSCRCDYQWMEPLCDHRDTNYYVLFRAGFDTTALSGLIRARNFSITPDIWKFFDFEGSFLPGSSIDTITLTQLPPFPGEDTNFAFCSTDTSCIHLESLLDSNEIAVAIAGEVTVDTVAIIINCCLPDVGGTFKANLYVSGTGEILYLREGGYFLPFYAP